MDKFSYQVFLEQIVHERLLYHVGVVSAGCRKSVVQKVVDSAVYNFLATASPEAEDGLGVGVANRCSCMVSL